MPLCWNFDTFSHHATMGSALLATMCGVWNGFHRVKALAMGTSAEALFHLYFPTGFRGP